MRSLELTTISLWAAGCPASLLNIVVRWRAQIASFSSLSRLVAMSDVAQNSKPPRGGSHGGRGGGGQRGGGKGKLRGLPNDSPEVRLSKTLSWLLRHGAQSVGLFMRPDGYVRVDDLLATPQLRDQDLALPKLQKMVAENAKQRFKLVQEPAPDGGPDVWWIRAAQGHSLATVKLDDLKPILTASDVPMAVHGTNQQAWKAISEQGLSKMKRNHIHLAQGVPSDGVISGMRNSAQVLIYIDLERALADGLKFYLSDNGVILSEGNEAGSIAPTYFAKVTDKHGQSIAR
ncbi:unnamed protein product [Peniophora sp. CBMAI 1063]|nr:unnamed protein product [Peniophora sp. CBMAI 1063]